MPHHIIIDIKEWWPDQDVLTLHDGWNPIVARWAYQIGDKYFMEDKALRYNEGKPDWSLVHFPSLEPMVHVLKYGEKKYTVWEVSGRDNWKKSMPKHQILNSMMRHLIRLMEDEELDSESNLPHIGHILANCQFYSYHSHNDIPNPMIER